MSTELNQYPSARPFWRRVLAREDVLAGLMFAGVAAVGLWVSRDYTIGTALRMGTGYVPRLLCWALLALGIAIAIGGFRAAESIYPAAPQRWRPIVFIPAGLVVFALTAEGFGILVAGLLLIGIGALGGRELRPLEIVAAAVGLVFFTWAIFVWALGLPIPVWPGG